MINRAGSSHIGTASSMAELLAVLYGRPCGSPAARLAGPRPLHLSKGHAVRGPLRRARRARLLSRRMAGYLLSERRAPRRPCHAPRRPGVEVSTGSLGHGLSVARHGLLGRKRDGRPSRVRPPERRRVRRRLDLGGRSCSPRITGSTTSSPSSTTTRSRASAPSTTSWTSSRSPTSGGASAGRVREIDGHDLRAIASALAAPFEPGRPSCVIAHTVKGKGVYVHGKQRALALPHARRATSIDGALGELEAAA